MFMLVAFFFFFCKGCVTKEDREGCERGPSCARCEVEGRYSQGGINYKVPSIFQSYVDSIIEEVNTEIDAGALGLG
jgi:hypothetical protein